MEPTRNKIIADFLAHNSDQSTQFTSPDQTLRRRQYRAQNPVEIAAMKCMDGRINLPLITGFPIGIIRPFRNLGGKFDIGGHFGELLLDWVLRAVAAGKDSIVLVTYHWSRGAVERGCKGFHCEVDDAIAYTQDLVHDVEEVFGAGHEVVYPVQVGIETDEDALVFHGSGKKLDLSEMSSDDRDTLRIALESLYPDMKRRMIESLVNLCVGNIRHISAIRKAARPIADINHKETMLGVGPGFNWFHLPNQMLIVGPYSYDLAEPIAVAGKILLNNINSGSIPKEDGCVLLTSATYWNEGGPEKARATMKARSLMRFAQATLKEKVPELVPYLNFGAGILNENTILFTPIDFEQ